MDDLIRRQDAIELIENESRKWGDEYGISDVLCDLADMPSSQAEPKQITPSDQEKSDKFGVKSGKTCADTISRQDTLQLFETAFENNWTVSDTMDALKNLPSAQPEQRWIPVSERLPKVDNISKRVLVTTSWGVVKEAYYCVDHWSIDDVDYKFSVAAWMPLPEPWGGEKE